MGVALIARGRFFDRRGQRVAVPAPSTNPAGMWLLHFLAHEALHLRQVGFTAVQLAAASKAQRGTGAGCDGDGLFDPRDLGGKNQQGSIPTRRGNRTSPARSSTILTPIVHRQRAIFAGIPTDSRGEVQMISAMCKAGPPRL